MNATDFFLKYNGKPLDYDGVNGAQCVDVIKAYFKEVLGKEPFKGNAIDYWNKDVPGMERFPNSWITWPKPGDVIVWDTSVSPFGHIAVVNWVRTFDFGGFEQNFPVGSPCHYQDHSSYKGVLGWLRPAEPTSATYHFKYLSDRDDIGPSVKVCDQKLKEFSKGRIGLSYEFQKIPRVDAPPGQNINQDVAWAEVAKASGTFHGVVLEYRGTNPLPFYHTAVSPKPVLYSAGQLPWGPDILLFELKHQLITFYNRFRGSNPYIENIDNYSLGEAIVKKQVEDVAPYFQVFNRNKHYL